MNYSDPVNTQIKHISWRPYCGKNSQVPYIVANIVWKVDKEVDPSLWGEYKAGSEDYGRVLSIESIESFEKHVDENWLGSYGGYKWVIQPRDAEWRYIPKFDVFWMREWVSDCSVVRSALYELEHIAMLGKPADIYRSTTDYVIMCHLRTIFRYWD